VQWGLTLKGDLAMTISCSILGDRLSRTTVISWSPTTDGASASFYLVNCLVALTLMILNVTTASAAGAGSGMTNNTAAMTNKAVFLIVDGIPADVIERVVTPNLDAIAKVGGYTRAEVGGPLNGPAETPTVSAPGYMSLVTGTWANKHNVYGNAGLTPNYDYWNLFRLAKSVEPPLQTGIFSTWTDNRTVLLGAGLANAGSVTIDFVADGFETDAQLFPHAPQDRHIQAIDRHVAAEAARVIEQAGPDLSWVYLQYTDDVGHARGDSPELDAAVEVMDELVGTVWSAVQARAAGHDEDWLILITTDHGRDVATGRDHGGQSERERTTWMVTNSHRLSPRFYQRPAIVDIYPSLARHLEISLPASVAAHLDGRSFIE
jgi:predicted AlkP superfamily pyrophosphatase or phosphodiesterase